MLSGSIKVTWPFSKIRALAESLGAQLQYGPQPDMMPFPVGQFALNEGEQRGIGLHHS